MPIKTLNRSFASGIIGPELYGRLDLANFQTGLAECKNFWVLPHGPAQNRPGFEYVLEAKDSTKKSRVIPFSYNTEQTFVIEFGDQYLRWHTGGATLLETGVAITGISKANPGVLTYSGADPVSGDWMYLSGIVGMTELNGRYVKVANLSTGPNTFELTDIHGGANINTTGYSTYTSGGNIARVYTLATPYLEADLFDLHFVQSADVLTITHPNYAPRELRRLGAASWTLTVIPFAPGIAAPASASVSILAGTGTDLCQYKTTATAEGSLEESYPSPVAVGPTVAALTGVTKANPGVFTTVADHGRAVDEPVYITDVVGMTEVNGTEYLIASTPTLTTFTLKSLGGVALDTTGFTTYVSGGTVYLAGVKNDLYTVGNKNRVNAATVSGAIRYNFYKSTGGLFGYIGQSASTFLVDDNITPDTSRTPPEENEPFVGATNYPGAVGYHEQRRCFGGTDSKPQNFWATRSATESNLSSSIPSRDDDAISFRIAAREVNRIRHIVSVDQLLLLTSGGEWKVAPQNSDILTPTSAAPKQIANEGASNVQPVLAANAVLYGQESGCRLLELKYKWEANGYSVTDASILAPHLFDDYTLVDLAYSKTPNRMVWAARSDGTLLGLTYLPEHNVLGWHEHDTDGLFESVACVKEGTEHVLYAVVKRTINSRAVRYIERLHTRKMATPSDAFFVDAGLTYDGAPTTGIAGLWHLEGEEVSILADAAEVSGLTVSGGAITLPQEASVVQVGIPFVADFKTLPLSLETQAFGQGLTKNVNSVSFRVHESSGWKVGPTFDAADMVGVTVRTDESYGTPPALATGIVDVTIFPEWGDDAQICVRQSAPLPVTLLSLTLGVAIGG